MMGEHPERPDIVVISLGERQHRVKRMHLEVLDWVRRTGSISSACRAVGVTYKTALSWLQGLEALFGRRLVESERGGKRGGGSRLTEDGIAVIERYYAYMSTTRGGFTRSLLELRMSARNVLEGVVVGVKTGGEVCRVDVRIEAPQVISAIITSESLTRLGIREGETVSIVLKATEAMIMK